MLFDGHRKSVNVCDNCFTNAWRIQVWQCLCGRLDQFRFDEYGLAPEIDLALFCLFVVCLFAANLVPAARTAQNHECGSRFADVAFALVVVAHAHANHIDVDIDIVVFVFVDGRRSELVFDHCVADDRHNVDAR